ncbi:unnamed protein product [Brachionus calyciflorus]|uniref:FAS1 domain-containing protein n=1 Tax=Brachionus calyciflorus TaxID=104777 RepID=A0A813NHV7_9BILA|nr:unnamed protein product [Brachionus calyciflorus]
MQQFNPNFNQNQQFPNQNQQFPNQNSQLPNQNQQFSQNNQQQFAQNTQQTDGALQQTIYQFIKSNSRTTRFAEMVDRVSQANIQSLINVLSASDGQATGRAGYAGLTAFVPVNEAINQIPNDMATIKNDIENLVVTERLNLDRLRELNGQNISKTLGYKPRLVLRTVKNFYLNNQDAPKTNTVQKRQINSNDSSAFDMYSQINPNLAQSVSSNSPISSKLPYDEVFLLNNALILDMFELTNGIVYLINAYPRFYDKSLLVLLNDNDVNGLGQNLNYWIARAAQSFRLGDENLKNALNAYGPNTYFLPIDSALNKFNDREKLNNNSFLFDQLFKSHRVSNRILFDYYLDESSPVILTDTGLPVNTKHYRVNNQDLIEVSIGHVKGRILPEYRNIYCASGVIHLVDTVLAIPGRNAYQEISNTQELSTFKTLIDRSQKYRQILDQTPNQNLLPPRSNFAQRAVKRQMPNNSFNTPENMNQNQGFNNQGFNNQFTDFKLMTLLAPSDSALIGIRDELLKNDSAIEEFLSNHIIVDNNANRVFYTEHDESVFQNSQTYSTMNPSFMLTAKVTQDPISGSNIITLQLANNPSIRTSITKGNSRVSNGVVHVVDRALSSVSSSDITSLLEKYSAANMPNQPAFNQFVEALRSTGIFNDLKQPAKKYTLFIPTNEALSRYQDVFNSNDDEKKKKLLYRHICMDQNLQSNLLQTSNQAYQDLICRNLLGQDLTLTKDQSGLVSKWTDKASSKILNDFSGLYSSAYVLEEPLLNTNLPNYGLNNLNSGFKISNSNFIVLICIGFFAFWF